MNLKNRVVLVTGAARGIGAEISFQMCKAGAKVILSDLLNKEGKLKVTELTKLGYESAYIEQDVTKESSWKKTIKFCEDAKFILIKNKAPFMCSCSIFRRVFLLGF